MCNLIGKSVLKADALIVSLRHIDGLQSVHMYPTCVMHWFLADEHRLT